MIAVGRVVVEETGLGIGVFCPLQSMVWVPYDGIIGDVPLGTLPFERLCEAHGTRRLKLRTESERSELIYYRDHQEADTRVSHFQLWQMPDPGIIEVLEAAQGMRVVVRKRRELWHKDNIKFNLDEVEGVGRIFELEAQEMDGHDIDAQVEEYRSLLLPHIGAYITGSNEDLVGSDSGRIT